MSSKADFEAPDYDTADILQEDARIDALELAYDRQRLSQGLQAFEQQALRYAVSSCLNSCLDSLDLLYVPREEQPISNVAIAHDSWRQEAEPEPCSRDSWLRGAIPETPAITSVSSASSQQAATIKPKSRPQSGLTVRRGGPGSVASTTADGEAGQRPKSGSTASVRGRTAAAAGQTTTKPIAEAASRASHSSKASGKQLTQEQQAAEARLRQELQIRRQQEAVAKELKQKDEMARTALLSMQKDLKGKDYTYDSSGKVVLMNKINPEALPAPPGPQFKVHTTAPADADAPAATKTAKSSSSSTLTSSSKAKASKKAAAGTGSSDFIQTATVTQPPVLETLRPAAGVTLRAGAGAKQGPKREAASPTRTQYQQQAKAQNQQAARAARPAAAARASMAGTGGINTSSSIRSSIISNSGTQSAAATPTANSRVLSALATNSTSSNTAATGSTTAAAAASSRLSSATAAGALRPAPAAAAAPKRPPSPDVNMALVSAADWGVASGGSYAPPEITDMQKPNEKQIKEEFGRTTHLPKSRAPVATLKPPSAQPGSTISAKRLLGSSSSNKGQ